MIASMSLALYEAEYVKERLVLPTLLSAAGIFCSAAGVFSVNTDEEGPCSGRKRGTKHVVDLVKRFFVFHFMMYFPMFADIPFSYRFLFECRLVIPVSIGLQNSATMQPKTSCLHLQSQVCKTTVCRSHIEPSLSRLTGREQDAIRFTTWCISKKTRRRCWME